MVKNPGTLLIYIGNNVVRSGLLKHKSADSSIIGSIRTKEVDIIEGADMNYLKTRIISSLKDLLAEVRTRDLTTEFSTGMEIKHIHVTISSPWYHSETKTIKIEEPKPIIVLESLAQKALDDLIKAFSGSQNENITVIEQEVLSTFLNGYLTHRPFGKSARKVDIRVFTSYALQDFVHQIKDTIETEIHHGPAPVLHSQSLVSFLATKKLIKESLDHVILDITSELTEIIVVRGGAVAEAATIPIGKRKLIINIAERLNTTYDSCVSLLKMHAQQKLDDDLMHRIKDVFESSKSDWSAAFMKALAQIANGKSLPSDIALFAPRDVIDIFKELIQKEEFGQVAYADGSFVVYTPDPVSLDSAISYDKGTPPDLAITLCGSHAHAIHYDIV
jgi:cell division ATPase FtsA